PARGHDLEAPLPEALLAHGVYHVGARAPALDQVGDQLGRVLQVTVHHHDDVALGAIEAGGQRLLVAEVAREEDDADPAVVLRQPLEDLTGAVGGAVVHQHELPCEPVEGRGDPLAEGIDGLLLAENRSYDAYQEGLAAHALVTAKERQICHLLPVQPEMALPSDLYDSAYFLSDCCEGFGEYESGVLSPLKARQVEILAPAPGVRVLDAGCGSGEVLRACAERGADVAGVDYWEAAVEISRETLQEFPTAEVVQGLVESLPWPDAHFDRIVFGDVIE